MAHDGVADLVDAGSGGAQQRPQIIHEQLAQRLSLTSAIPNGHLRWRRGKKPP